MSLPGENTLVPDNLRVMWLKHGLEVKAVILIRQQIFVVCAR